MNEKRTLYVGGLAVEVNKEVLQSLFIPFGEISQIIIPTDPDDPSRHKGFAFVEFELAEDAADALDNMHNAELYNRVLKINHAKPQTLNKLSSYWELKSQEEQEEKDESEPHPSEGKGSTQE